MEPHEIRATYYGANSKAWNSRSPRGGWFFEYLVNGKVEGYCSAPGPLIGKKAQSEMREHVGIILHSPEDYFSGDLNITFVKANPHQSYNVVRDLHEWLVADGAQEPLGAEMRAHRKKAKSARSRAGVDRSIRMELMDARHQRKYGYDGAPGAYARRQIAQRAA